MREATGDAIRASRRAARRAADIRSFVIATVAALVMAILAPLGTGRIGIEARLLYWLLLMEAGALFGIVATRSVARWGRLEHRPWLEGLLVSVLIAVPLTVVVAFARTAFFGLGLPGPRAGAIMFSLVLMISAILVAISYAVERRDPPAGPDAAVDPAAALAERLPLPLRGLAILALEAEDHYLRVHLEGGRSALILMRLTDAVAALAAVPGARTHRSWWVAKAAVTRIAKADGRAVLTLEGGLEAPVSRTYYRALADAGWLT